MVAKDTLDTVGTLLEGGEGRDAVHIAMFSALAAEELRPGERVRFANKGTHRVVTPTLANPIGIADPFLMEMVPKGGHCWIFLFPRQITGLRHVWTHPAFPEEK